MGLIVKFVQTDPKTGRLVYRRAFPADLKPFLEKPRREFKAPLGGKDITKPPASVRYNDAQSRYEREVARAAGAARIKEKEDARAFDPITPELIDYLAGVLVSDKRRAMEEILQEGHGGLLEVAWTWLLDELRKARASGNKALLVDILEPTMDSLLVAEGVRLDPDDTEGRTKLAWDLAAKLVSSTDEIKKHLQGFAPPIPERPKRPSKPAPEKAQDSSESFEATVEKVLASVARPVSPSAQQATRTALRFFRETHGSPRPSEITRAMVAEWVELLAQRPAQLPKSEAERPLREVVKRYAGRDDVPRLSAKTVLQHCSMLASRWKNAGQSGLLDHDIPNPFQGHNLKKPKKSKDPKGFNK